MRAYVCYLLLAALTLGCGSTDTTTGLSPSPSASPIALTILHNNDADSALLAQGDFGGVDRFATLVARQRQAAAQQGQGVLLLSGGNNLGAVPLFQVSLDKGPPYYDTLAMQQLGYAASAVGVSEFYFGPRALAGFLQGFNPLVPFLSANLSYGQEPALAPLAGQQLVTSTVAQASGVSVGLVGCTDPTLAYSSTPGNVTIASSLPGAVQSAVDKLTGQVSLTVLLANLGDLSQVSTLVGQLHGVQVVVAGGSGQVLANAGNLLVPGDQAAGPYPMNAPDAQGKSVPIVSAGSSYNYLGRLTLRLSSGGVQVDSSSGPLRVAGGSQPDAVPPDPSMQSLVTTPASQALAQLQAKVVATSEVSLDALNQDLRSQETNLGDLVADALLAQARQINPKVSVALINGGAMQINATLPAGPVSELTLEQTLPFASFVVSVPGVSASQFKELLENSVSQVSQGSGRFAQISGFSFTWSSQGTAQQVNSDGTIAVPGSRVQQVVLANGVTLVSGGAVVAGAPSVDVAALDFMARGGDQYPFRGAPFQNSGVSYLEAVRSYLQGPLAGAVKAASYPLGGTGRIKGQ